MIFKRGTVALAAATLATIGGVLAGAPSAAAATTNDATNAHKVVRVVTGHGSLQRESYSQFLSKAATKHLTVVHPASAPRGGVVTAATTNCWYYDDWTKGYGIFGQTEWTFNVEPNWCGDGSWISSAYNNTWGTTSWPGWAYKGLTQSTDRYGAGWNVYENVRQGHFCLAEYFNCVQNYYPYTDVEVGAGGQIYRS